MECTKELPSGIVATWREVVRTEMDYKAKTSRATVYYYLDEQSLKDGKEPVMGEVIDVPFAEEVELLKEDVSPLVKAEEAMEAKVEEEVEK